MQKLIPLILLICFTITEIEVIASVLDSNYVVEYSETFPDSEGEKEDEPHKDSLEKEDKSLAFYQLLTDNSFVNISFRYSQFFLMYCSPVQKIPVPPPEYS
ncbi:hypothetical protein [Fulvivirga lutimaris]|uniref:hypothetical protein n=1 Tax=Fulvivirga lutimaris TaxID=1819566 RepID=UPI001C86B0E7|nr:hypothetical protein [Fulvivirga lutimaris]MTI39164.1 hypothetical protein [Fulvivirga lutimaris]